MTSVIGLELDRAMLMLAEQGVGAVCVETASRKGVENGQKRVVRQRTLDDGAMELVWSAFKTECTQDE